MEFSRRNRSRTIKHFPQSAQPLYHYYYLFYRLSSQTFSSWYSSSTSGDPPPRLQVSHCSTSRIMCDIPSIALFCSGSIECFPGTTSKFFVKLLVTIPVAPIIIGIIVHFRFHVRCISIHKFLYLLLLSLFPQISFLQMGLSGWPGC